MEKHKRVEVSPQVPRIPKPEDLYERYHLQRPSKDEAKRTEQNFFIRRRGHKSSQAQESELYIEDDIKSPDALSQNNVHGISKSEDKKRSLRMNQPRQKPQEKKDPVNLNNLSNIVLEMKEMLNNMPNVQEMLNKTHEQNTKKNLNITPRNRSKEISLRDKTVKKSTKLKNYILSTRQSRRLMSSKGPRPTTQKRSKNLPLIQNKASEDLVAIQNYFLEFHAKSKFLLKNLEKNVLGEKKVTKSN
ncbi:hypothetical protein SteCoe_27380 [Stentor coeruleus]|uniref:Uncharacterized protein n=1 Tax=Stentor coeruleus TaxID=5963 RepID=A0A1R2BB52_9CILI|nr:hypothetical protein SteCoe_27380 [Stentor coeruleus]